VSLYDEDYMTDSEKWTLLGAVLLVVVLFVLVCFLFPFPLSAQVSENPQVVFQFDHVLLSGTLVVVPHAQPIYAIRAVEGTHPAPLSKDTLMLCHPYNEGAKYLLRCGMDRYVVEAISLNPEK
jgi:hypothetical protein